MQATLWATDPLFSQRDGDLSPADAWSEQEKKYDEYLQYWTGEIFERLADNVQVEPDQKPLRWPVKINLVKLLSMMHAMALWGEWEDNIITMRVVPKPEEEIEHPGAIPQKESAKRRAQEYQDVLNSVWRENKRETLCIEESLAQQVYGGAVFRFRNDPLKRYGIGIEYVSPYYFRPVWHPTDFHTLLEARVAFNISGQQANLVYGTSFEEHDEIPYIETWDVEQWTIRLRDKTYKQGKNIYGRIPFVYVPRLRMEEYYGLSLAEDLTGLQNELNDRVADIGDQILQECHAYKQLINYAGDPRDLSPGPAGIVNLGMNAPGRNDPRIDVVPAGDVPRGAFEYINFILDTSKMAAMTPPVAFGDDEGSQRSGITLIIRMWPLLQQCKWSRAWWNDGFREMADIIRVMLKVHKHDEYKEDFEGHIINPQWAPVQPKDREALVQELATLAGSDLQSIETMVNRLGDTEADDEEIGNIKAWMKVKAKMEKEAAQTVLTSGGGAERPSPST
tara:strand:+ start:9834 stop:11351 length:1518 start_codon:yes stop_codon:yes gene_type:complete